MLHGVIIVEGCDFSGKSTLIDKLSKELKAIVFKDNNIPPESVETAQKWIQVVNQLSKGRLVICDRSLIISDPIYGNIIRGSSPLGDAPNLERLQEARADNIQGPALLSELTNLRAIVWCNPGLDFILQMNNDQMGGVREKAQDLYWAYRESYDFYQYLMPINWVNLPYDLTSGPEGLKTLINQLKYFSTPGDPETNLVKDFHKKFVIPVDSAPNVLSPEVREFRVKFLQEELDEFQEAALNGDIVKMFDALLDLVYVAKGTALMMGVSPRLWSYGFNEVQRANMTKLRVSCADDSKRGSTLDVIKPPNFQPPESALQFGINLEIQGDS